VTSIPKPNVHLHSEKPQPSEECEEQAIKHILADQIKAAMEKDRLTKAAMAVRMQTSRRALDRLIDPNTSVTLHTLQRAALAVWPPAPP